MKFHSLHKKTMTIHARIVAYKGKIICELVALKSIRNEVLTTLDGGMRIGQLVFNTGKNLGVSDEALALLSILKPGKNALGDITWFSHLEGYNFGWLGSQYAIFDPREIQMSKSFGIFKHQKIINDVPPSAKKAIDALDKNVRKKA